MCLRAALVRCQCLVATCFLAVLTAAGAEVALQSQQWANTDAAFAEFAAAVAASRGRRPSAPSTRRPPHT